MLPSVSRNRDVTSRRLRAAPRPREIPARASRETPACRSARRGCASSSSRSASQVDARRRVSSVAPLTVQRRLNVPALFQRLADLLLSQLLLLRPIVLRVLRLPVPGNKGGDIFSLRFPIKIKVFGLGPQEILRMPMAFEAPRHAVRLGMIDDRHVIDLPMATRATDPAIHVRGVIVIHVIGRAMELHPLDRLSGFPTRPHRLKLRIVFLLLRMTRHTRLCVWKIRMRG